MSKVVSTKFVCDECGKTVEANDDPNMKFPYDKGWLYLFNYNSQYSKAGVVDRIVKQDNHLCSMDCLIKFVKKQYDLREGKKHGSKMS